MHITLSETMDGELAVNYHVCLVTGSRWKTVPTLKVIDVADVAMPRSDSQA